MGLIKRSGKLTGKRIGVGWLAVLSTVLSLIAVRGAMAAEMKSDHFHITADALSEAVVGNIAQIAEAEYESLSQWFGLTLKGRIQLLLYGDMESFKKGVGEGAPEWASALTRGNDIFIGPEGGGGGDNIDKLRAVLRHELCHVLFHAKMLGVTPPTWLDEGLAVFLSNEWDHVALWSQEMNLLGAALRGDDLFSIQDISHGFPPDADLATMAYLQSYAMVNFMMQHYGSDSFREFIDALGQGQSMDDACQFAFGTELSDIFQDWEAKLGDESTFWKKLVYNFNNLVFLSMGVLGLIAFIAVMARRRAIIARYNDIEGKGDEKGAEAMRSRFRLLRGRDIPDPEQFKLGDFNEYVKKRDRKKKKDPTSGPDETK